MQTCFNSEETLIQVHNLQLFVQTFFNLKETYVKTHWWKATQLQWVQLFSCKIQLSEDACWMFAHKIDICSYSYMQVQLAWRCIFKGFPQKRELTPMLKNPTQNIWSVAEVLAFYENKLTTKRWQTIDTWDNWYRMEHYLLHILCICNSD